VNERIRCARAAEIRWQRGEAQAYVDYRLAAFGAVLRRCSRAGALDICSHAVGGMPAPDQRVLQARFLRAIQRGRDSVSPNAARSAALDVEDLLAGARPRTYRVYASPGFVGRHFSLCSPMAHGFWRRR